MAKDPAFLFYPNDWLGGTMGMTFEEKGAYIELLMLQFNRGHMNEKIINKLVGDLWEGLKDKFQIDESGLFYNKRLEDEQARRRKYSESRRNNKEGKNQYSKGHMRSHMSGHMTSHMETENETENINVNYVYVKDLRIFEILDFLKSHYAIQLENIQMNLKIDLPKYSESFIKDRCQETFNDALHLLNAFKKYASYKAKEDRPERSNGYKDYYDQKYEKSLQGSQITEYHKHLIELGWTKTYSGTAGTIWHKPMKK